MLRTLQGNLRPLGGDVRWISVTSIHLTLKFLGEIDPANLAALSDALKKATASASSMTLRLRGLGCFPNLQNPRVIWCGVEGEIEKLSVLQENVERACESSGFPREDRPFRPHLTLGRLGSKKSLHRLSDSIKIGSELECSFRADRFNIYKSTLTPRGAVYEILSTILLSSR
jgi:2'-5' RNA ligase